MDKPEFFESKQQEIPGTLASRPLFVPPVCQGHPVGVPRIFSSLCAFLSLLTDETGTQIWDHSFPLENTKSPTRKSWKITQKLQFGPPRDCLKITEKLLKKYKNIGNYLNITVLVIF